MSTTPHSPNRLAQEKSPYLLQHALNPVDWYPWGEAAFTKARSENKPIFLSIGYATCHWCHVMERESFEDPAIAAFLNQHFVPIKVDREERPDVDQVYMQAVMAMAGQGGWPLSVFLTPDRRPFFGGTYFPPDDRFGRPGFPRLLGALAQAWQERRAEVTETAQQLTTHLAGAMRGGRAGSAALDESWFALGIQQAASSFDRVWGGFGRAPKFPRSHLLSFLLAAQARSGDPEVLPMVELTLDRMARGGMHDHLGGGFHRYSTDERWLVPHFEKMLYDQALIARSYLEAYQVTGNEAYAAVARAIFDYVRRDLRSPEGAFYSAEDADSEGEEGKFYVWTPAELEALLGPEDGRLFGRIYGATADGNFEHGTSILHLPRTLAEVAADERVTPEALASRLAVMREKLLAVRAHRIRPLLDDKVLTDWNGLMIGAFAYGARALGEPAYAETAAAAARFVLERLRTPAGLLKRYRDGEAAGDGFLDDYAFLAWGLLELHAATQDPFYLAVGRELAQEIVERFSDPQGGLFFTARDAEPLLIRTKEIYDGAVPSGNAVAALVFLRLGALLADPELTRAGRQVVETFAAELEAAPLAFPQMMLAAGLLLGPTTEVVLAGDPAHPELAAMRSALDRKFLPQVTVVVKPVGAAGERLAGLSPFLAGLSAAGGRPTAYVCREQSCSLPVHTAAEMLAQVERSAPARDRLSTR
ncbi:MAG TPA: thioredoxin domain-containing protein [Candidatus Udaeobacter sp.]|nr:thioredoxin domain-containing protein [Candidatus Udaeobacter sp.]